MAGQRQIISVTPVSLFRFGSEAEVRAGQRPISIASGSRDPFGAHTPTTNLRRGLVLGKRTADGYYGPMVRTALSATEASGQTVLSVDSVEGFSVGDNVYVNNAAFTDEFDGGAITAIDSSALTITITNALDTQYAADSYVYLSNGLGVAKCVLADSITVVDSDGDDLGNLDATAIVDTGTAALLSGSLPNIDPRALVELRGSNPGDPQINFGI